MCYRCVSSLLATMFVVFLLAPLSHAVQTIPEELAKGKLEFNLERNQHVALLLQLDPKDYSKYPIHVAYAERFLGLPPSITNEQLEAYLRNAEQKDRTRLRLANLYYKDGDCRNALKHLKGKPKSLTATERDRRAYLRGQCFIELGNHNFAAQSLSSALEGEYAATAYFNLAADYAATSRNPKRALMSLKVARDINDTKLESSEELENRINLSAGALYLDHNRPELANDFFNQISLDSVYVSQALYLAGLAKAEIQDYRGAIQAWQSNFQHGLMQPGVAQSLLAMPNIQAQSGYEAQALESFIKVSALFEKEQEDIERLISALKKYGVIDVLVEERLNQDLEWFLDKGQATNTRRASYMRFLSKDADFMGLLNDHAQLVSLERSLDRSKSQLSNLASSLRQQKKRIDSGASKRSYELKKRGDELKSRLDKLEAQLDGNALTGARQSVEQLSANASTIDKRSQQRRKLIQQQLKEISAALSKIDQQKRALTAFLTKLDKEMTTLSEQLLGELKLDMAGYFEQAELGLIQILEAQARLRSKRTNLLDGRYQ